MSIVSAASIYSIANLNQQVTTLQSQVATLKSTVSSTGTVPPPTRAVPPQRRYQRFTIQSRTQSSPSNAPSRRATLRRGAEHKQAPQQRRVQDSSTNTTDSML
jgi:hypothetical protein